MVNSNCFNIRCINPQRCSLMEDVDRKNENVESETLDEDSLNTRKGSCPDSHPSTLLQIGMRVKRYPAIDKPPERGYLVIGDRLRLTGFGAKDPHHALCLQHCRLLKRVPVNPHKEIAREKGEGNALSSILPLAELFDDRKEDFNVGLMQPFLHLKLMLRSYMDRVPQKL